MKVYDSLSRFSLHGQTALVTGASRGIGRALALGLANAAADIVAVGRNPATLETLARDIESMGQRAYRFKADVSKPDDIDALFEWLRDQDLCVQILINNAGVEQVSPSVEVTEALWDRIVDTNLKGAFFMARGFARTWLAVCSAQPAGSEATQASIINLGSLTSAVGIPTATPYTSSKSGLLGMTRALASEWAPQRIRVNALGPGYFRTDLTEGFYADDGWQDRMLGKIPMARFGELDDLIGATLFLASRASSYMTGQILYVDGGCLATL